MRSRSRQLVILVLVTSLLISTATVAAQNSVNDWSRVTALAAGSRLAVKLKNGKTLNGTLSSVTDSALSLMVKNASVETKREDVATVHEVIKKSATKATLIGTGVGAGAGAAAGAIQDSSSDGFEKIDAAATAALTILGAGVGAFVGYLVGRGGNKRVLIYEAK